MRLIVVGFFRKWLSFSGPRTTIWQQTVSWIEPLPSAKPTGWLCLEHRALPLLEIELLEIVPGHGLHIRTFRLGTINFSWPIQKPQRM